VVKNNLWPPVPVNGSRRHVPSKPMFHVEPSLVCWSFPLRSSSPKSQYSQIRRCRDKVTADPKIVLPHMYPF
jgi:hypothetical protein